MHTEAINHDPAMTFFQTGSQQAGRPVDGGVAVATASGTENENLPAFIVLISRRPRRRPAALRRGCGAAASCRRSTRACSSAAARDPVLYLGDPAGSIARAARRMLDTLRALNEQQHARVMRPGDQRPHRAVRDGVSHADGRPRADRLCTTSRSTSSTCTGPRPACPARSPPTACWPGGWPSGTCGSSSSITRAGISTAICRPTSRR